ILYLGYGQTEGDYNDFEEGDLANRIVIIREGRPAQFGPTRTSELESNKLEAAREAGVRLILVISNQYNSRLGRYRQILTNPSISTKLSQSKRTNVVYISPRMAEQILSGYEDDVALYDETKYSSPKQSIHPVVIRK